MAFIREYRKGEHTYYAEVESYRNEDGQPRQRVLRWLGTSKTIPPDPIPVEGLDIAEIALKLMDESLTTQDVFEVLDLIGKRPADLDELEAVGITFDMAQKKLTLFLLPKGFTWTMDPPGAPSAAED